MELIAHKFGPGEKQDRLECVRSDASRCEVRMPRQRILPHDLVHAVVESRLRMSDGFIGLVAKGADIDFEAQELHRYVGAGCHAQVSQAESVVESLQAQLWSEAFDEAAFRYGVECACAMRGVAAPDLSSIDARRDLYDAAHAFGTAWNAVPAGATWRLRYPLDGEG